jgi:anthranilate/para-aminobenzoate synthase component II
LSKDFSVNAWTEDGTIMGIKHNSQKIYGLQFHPESLKTMYGMTMLNNFLEAND